MSATAITISQVAAVYGVSEGRIAELVESNAGVWYEAARISSVCSLVFLAVMAVLGLAAVAFLVRMAKVMDDGLGYHAAVVLLVLEVAILWSPTVSVLQSPAMADDPGQAYLRYLVEEANRGEPVQVVYAGDATDAVAEAAQ